MLPTLVSTLLLSAHQSSEVQTFEGMEIRTTLAFTARTVPQPGVKVWTAQAEATSSQLATQALLIITDLRLAEKRLTSEEVCRKHEATERGRRGFSGQFLKAERTSLGGSPMVVITGTCLTKDLFGKSSSVYTASSAVVKGDFSYELSWITRDPGVFYQKALDACRTMSFINNGQRISPKSQVGTSGTYSLSGGLFGFKLPAPAAPEPTVFYDLPFSQRYKAKLVTSDWMVRVDTGALKPEIKAEDPRSVFALFGYKEFIPKEGGPKPASKDGVWVFDQVAVSEKTIARVEVGFKDGQASCMIISADKAKGLPSRELLSLQSFSQP